MDEKDVRVRIKHALYYRGYWPVHLQDGRVYLCPKGHPIMVTPEQKGLPDLLAMHPKFPTTLIEVKDCKGTAFAFDEISDKQRKYLDTWQLEGGAAYLGIGGIVPVGTKTKIHSIYLIPWDVWRRAEQDSLGLLDEKSIPYSYSFYTNQVQRKGPDIETRFRSYRLERREGDWHLADSHAAACQPELDVPFHKRERVVV